jgi:FkbM family methyltransferase
MSYPSKSFLLRHKLISFLRNLDIKGIRRLSIALPKILLPNPQNVGKHELKTIYGTKLLVDPSIDQGVELSLFETGTYEMGTIDFIMKTLKSGDSFLDVGANIGWITTLAAKKTGAKGIVYAVEANPKTVPLLQHNVALNGLTNVEILPIGVSDVQGTGVLFENWTVNRGGASLIAQGEENGIVIEIDTLDHLFSPDTPIHMVKIDVEGKEPEVIRGGQQWFKQQQPIFIVEISNVREHNSGATGKETLQAIKAIGNYSFWKHSGTKERKGKLTQIKDLNELPIHDNIICIPQ